MNTTNELISQNEGQVQKASGVENQNHLYAPEPRTNKKVRSPMKTSFQIYTMFILKLKHLCFIKNKMQKSITSYGFGLISWNFPKTMFS